MNQREALNEWVRGECVKCGQSIERQKPVAYGMRDTMLGKENRMMMVRLDKGQDGCNVPLYPPPPQPEPVIGTKTWFEDGKVVTQHLTAKDIYKDLEPVIDKSAAVRIATALGWEPKRTWQGLTDKEICPWFQENTALTNEAAMRITRAIESKLREKNAQPSKPLTDVEIWKFWWSRPEVAEGEDDSMEAEFVAAVRRVLAAHGIKE